MVANEVRELTDDDHELIRAATEMIEANGADPVHTVAAVVRTADGAIHGGLNLYHFTGGPCAELVALAAARSAGARQPVAIVAVGHNGRGVLGPCGRDRQIFSDYYPDIRVILPTNEGLRSASIEALLPWATQWQPESPD